MSLAHAVVTADGATPDRSVLFLHGILGSGANWRGFARRLVTAHPEWAAVLVDLRMHGDSQHEAPPHTVARAADDLVVLERTLSAPVSAVIGHSFGGKVALAYAAERGASLSRLYVLDSTPGARPDAAGSEGTVAVVEMLSQVATTVFPTRRDFVEQLTGLGQSRVMADWLAMSLAPAEGGVRLRFDMGAIRALLADYFARDLWPVIESPPGDLVCHVVLGGRSSVFSSDDRARLFAIESSSGGRVHAHVLPDAGHWVHVDDPDGLFAVISGSL